MSSKNEKVVEHQDLTLENIETALANDTKVKLAGIDVDGQSVRQFTTLADIYQEF